MNNELYKEVIRNEVMPAMGCTEQGCLAMACALAAKQTGSKIALNDRIKISVDPALFKKRLALRAGDAFIVRSRFPSGIAPDTRVIPWAGNPPFA
ncbi:MAG: hypothetical protein EOM69_12745 [Clostridia bacterium]|nr:hypothetical protein [Clostridia bacterium]